MNTLKLQIADCTVSIDVQATRDYYTAHGILNDCSCTGCENFRQYVPQFPETVRQFFCQCGIDDMRLIAEIIPWFTQEDGLLFYGGWFHVAGTMEGGTHHTDSSDYWESNMLRLYDSFSVWFRTDLALVPKNFPRPALQMEIDAHLPWVIAAENEY